MSLSSTIEKQNNKENTNTNENIEELNSGILSDDDEEEEEEEDDDDNNDSDLDSKVSGEQKVAIDLSDNDFYKGMCTLLEDEHGNNLLEYISLLHTELIGVNKNLRTLNKSINTIATCAQIMTKKNNKV